MNDASKISANGWQQGSVLPDELTGEVRSSTGLETANPPLSVVLSQDCDLVHPSYETEPTVELIVGRLVDAADNNLRHGRNPRATNGLKYRSHAAARVPRCAVSKFWMAQARRRSKRLTRAPR